MFKDKQVKSLAGGADVTQYMKATHVNKWLVVALGFIIVACMAIWISVGTLKTTLPITGLNENGKMVFYASPVQSTSLDVGQKIEYEGKTVGVITEVGLSQTEEQVLAEYADESDIQQIELYSVNIIVRADLDPKACPDGVVSVDVITAEMTPFGLF